MTEVISDRYSVDDIERAMDRVAEEIEANRNGASLLPLYEWFEQQLEARRRRQSTMNSVKARLARKRGGI
ncbi:hypothetical protein SAMN05880590_1076 [Rhizobium sp. RU35A]|uniref:hypothetical protein n=1 Tax=Rhizobium sp. RU35A TaxID=1907414 RepID=UPI0009570024|nr:hypothetical protein [Rhizobium sp. RU35A]SIQ75256.1 hypothetical protein SAMN05880590_1076 [Rhizobium sp. RU35A]